MTTSINGGSIDGCVIGATTPAAGTFTTLNFTNLTATTPSVNDNSTKIATTAFVLGQAGTALPLIAGTAFSGTSYLYARQDHVHPTDTTRAPLNSPIFTGTPTAATPFDGDVSLKLATTAFVANAISVNNVTATPSAEVKHVNVITASGAVAMGANDRYIMINKTSGAATAVTLVASPATGRIVSIKDAKGDAATNNITVTAAAGNIDGSASIVLNTNYAAVDLIYNGTQWNVV